MVINLKKKTFNFFDFFFWGWGLGPNPKYWPALKMRVSGWRTTRRGSGIWWTCTPQSSSRRRTKSSSPAWITTSFRLVSCLALADAQGRINHWCIGGFMNRIRPLCTLEIAADFYQVVWLNCTASGPPPTSPRNISARIKNITYARGRINHK